MLEMHFFHQRWSFCRTALLTIFLEFSFADKSRPTSNQAICRGSNSRNISYFKLAIVELDWNRAWQECIKRKSNLPVICTKNEQDAFMTYLKGRSSVWTSGRKNQFFNWTWIDGQPFNTRRFISSEHESYTHVALELDSKTYKALEPVHKCYYLCQYSGSSCNSEHVIKVTKGCVRPSDDDRSWYDARNQCLKDGGDLAILTDADLVTLRGSNKLDARFSYWIGLRKIAWHWIWQESANSSEDVKYSNWSNETLLPRYECISIDASNGEWTAVGCMDRKKVVCQRISTTLLPASVGEVCVGYATFTSVVMVGVCVIVISNVIVAFVVRKVVYRNAQSARQSETTANSSYQDMETTRRQANPDRTYTELQLQPVYVNVEIDNCVQMN